MSTFYLDKEPGATGACELHQSPCYRIGLPTTVVFLGKFESCDAAFAAALKVCDRVNGCMLCCRECYTPE